VGEIVPVTSTTSLFTPVTTATTTVQIKRQQGLTSSVQRTASIDNRDSVDELTEAEDRLTSLGERLSTYRQRQTRYRRALSTKHSRLPIVIFCYVLIVLLTIWTTRLYTLYDCLNYNCSPKLVDVNANSVDLFSPDYDSELFNNLSASNNSIQLTSVHSTNVCSTSVRDILWKYRAHPLNYRQIEYFDDHCNYHYYLGRNDFLYICKRHNQPIVIFNKAERRESDQVWYGSRVRVELTWEQFCSVLYLSSKVLLDIEKYSF